MNDILRQIADYGILPVIKIEDASKAVPVAKALANGGIPVAEVQFRTEASADAIRNIAAELPEILVGAGTILTTEQVDQAVEAGAKFIVSPGFNPKIVRYCIEKGVPVCPGCTSCGEMEQAMELGLDVVKFFPAQSMGGTEALKALYGPYPNLKFIPMGGINEENLVTYLKTPNVLACGGSFIAKDTLIQENKFDEIEKLAKETLALMHGFEILHVGINSADKEEGERTAAILCKLFLLEPDVREKATFAGTKFEVMHLPFRGKYGHVAIGCNFPDRARSHLERLGVEFDDSTATYDENGKLKFVYFKDDIGGFAFHLIKK